MEYVLVVDDEAHIRRMLSLRLRKSGLKAEVAADGREALEFIGARPPNLIVTDYQMPEVDGLALCRRLLDDSTTAAIPIILLTGRGYELGPRELAAFPNITAVLCKPFSPEEILGLIERELSRSAP